MNVVSLMKICTEILVLSSFTFQKFWKILEEIFRLSLFLPRWRLNPYLDVSLIFYFEKMFCISLFWPHFTAIYSTKKRKRHIWKKWDLTRLSATRISPHFTTKVRLQNKHRTLLNNIKHCCMFLGSYHWRFW